MSTTTTTSTSATGLVPRTLLGLVTLALLIAATSTGAAVAGSLVTSKQIKNGTITSADIKNRAIKRRDLAQTARGTRGPAGPVGPQGGPGVVSSVSVHGDGARAVATQAAFLAEPAVVVLGEGHHVSITSTKSLGTNAPGGAQQLRLRLCYQSTVPGSGLEVLDFGILDVRAATGTLQPYTLSGILAESLTGTFRVGLCGSSPNATDWNLAGESITTALVFRAA